MIRHLVFLDDLNELKGYIRGLKFGQDRFEPVEVWRTGSIYMLVIEDKEDGPDDHGFAVDTREGSVDVALEMSHSALVDSFR